MVRARGKWTAKAGGAAVGRVRGGEELEADGGDPVGEGRLFEVADAVDVEGDPVAGGEHGLGGLGVGGVGVVEQWRGGDGGDEDDEPEAEEDEDVGAGPARAVVMDWGPEGEAIGELGEEASSGMSFVVLMVRVGMRKADGWRAVF